MWREADALTELSASGGYSRDAILPQRMFTPCGEDPQGRCNLLRRATSLARYAYLSGMRAMRPAVFRVTNRRLEPVSLPGKVLPVPGTAWTLLLSRRKPWQRRSLLLREFLWHRTLRLRLIRGDIYSLRCPRDMPRSLHYDRSAPHVCHWHTGCTKRFSSKRQLFLHLGEEHGLQPDAERGGFRATGLGARARRRESRAALSRRPRPRSPVDQRFNALQTSPLGETWFDSVPPNSSLPPPAWAALPPPPTSATMPRPAPPTSSLLPTTMMTQQPPPTTTSMSRPPGHYIRGVRFDRCLPPSAPFLTDSVLPDGYALSAGLSSTGSAQLPGGSGRNAATGSTPSGASADMKPPLVSAPAERPPSGSNGSRTISAERPPVSAETPTASPAGRPPLTTCVSRLKGRHFGVSPGPVPIRPPARPRGDVDDDLWVRRPRPWNSWTRDSSLDAANVGF